MYIILHGLEKKETVDKISTEQINLDAIDKVSSRDFNLLSEQKEQTAKAIVSMQDRNHNFRKYKKSK